MATVTDSSLLTAAQDIVTNFLDKKASLNDGIIKKAGELGLNTDQTSRLIERTNTEAFLRIYPNDTEFEVASPEVILGIKTASVKRPAKEEFADDGMFKAASVQKEEHVKKANYYDRFSDEDIFGMDNDFFKTASVGAYEDAIDRDSQLFLEQLCETTKTASEQRQHALEKQMAFDNAMNEFGELVKQASLRGEYTTGDAETELLNKFPEASALITSTFDAITTKLASDMVNPDLLTRSLGIENYKYASETPLTYKFREVIKAARDL